MIKLFELYSVLYNDDLGREINKDATIGGLIDCKLSGGSIYDYIGVNDSVVRERLFQYIADSVGSDYDPWLTL